MNIGKHFGALAVTASVLTATAAPVPQPPEVKLTAESTVLTVCGVTCPAWLPADIERIMDQFVTPTHPLLPGDTVKTVAVTAPGELWPLTGLARLVLLALADPRLGGLGGGAWPDVPLWKLSGLFDLTANQSVQVGAIALQNAMAANPSGHQVIYGYSQGAGVANVVKRRLAAQYPGPTAPDIDFVLGGDPNLPNGGLMSRFPGLYIPLLDFSFNGAAKSDTEFDTVEINGQYDGFVDFPLYPLNFLATVNAILGIAYVHGWPFNPSLPADDPTKSPAYQGVHGDTSYYFFESQDLPLFAPLRTLGVPEALIDVVEPFFRVLVELGYDRSIPAWEPTPARLIPRLDPAKVLIDLINAVGEGINNAAAIVGLPPLVRTPAPAVAPEMRTQMSTTGTTPTTTITGAGTPEPFTRVASTEWETDTTPPAPRKLATRGTGLASSEDSTPDPSPSPEPEERAALAEDLEGDLEVSDPPSSGEPDESTTDTGDDGEISGSETGDSQETGDTERAGDTGAGAAGTNGQPNDA